VAERQSRAYKLLKLLAVPPLVALQAWDLTASKTISIQGSLAAFLPASLKPAVLIPLGSVAEPQRSSDFIQEQRPIVNPPPPIERGVGEARESESRALVVLLGDENEFSTTRALLAGNKFTSIIRSSIGGVDPGDLFTACAIVVGKSTYYRLNSQEQLNMFSEVARSNGQAWLRFGADGLAPENLSDIVGFKHRLGFSAGRVSGIQVSETSALTSVDIGYIASFAKQLDECLESSLLVDGLSEQQGVLVALAVRRELTAAGLDHLVNPIINVQMMSGRSGAKVMGARVEGCHHPFILRLGSRSSLLESQWGAELDKIKRLIVPWKPALLPSVYNVGDDAILVYASVTKSQQPDSVAATLAERLRQIQSFEPPFPPGGLPVPEELNHAIEEAFGQLAGLNRTTVHGDIETYRYVLEDYERMIGAGRGFRFDSEITPLEALLEVCLEKINSVSTYSVNHGDPHTGNILLPANSHAELIDFERVHVGHPLYDTCHLAVSIAATSYRSYGTFEEIVACFSTALFDGSIMKSDDLSPESRVNQTVLQSLISSKKSATALADHFTLPDKSFPSMLTVVCTVALMLLPHLQSNVVKAMIVAAERELLKPTPS